MLYALVYVYIHASAVFVVVLVAVIAAVLHSGVGSILVNVICWSNVTPGLLVRQGAADSV